MCDIIAMCPISQTLFLDSIHWSFWTLFKTKSMSFATSRQNAISFSSKLDGMGMVLAIGFFLKSGEKKTEFRFN